ncbi:sodium:solute symporter, partial [Bacteroidota bacterium]
FFGAKLNLDWTGIIDEINAKIASDGYSLFSIFFTMMLFKGILVSAAGPAPNYDMQKILATKNPKEAAMMSGFVSVVLQPVRYFMIAGFGILGLLFYDKLDLVVGGQIDFEQVLPSAISQFVPIGFMGLLLAGLMAAFMSTFAGTLNAAQAYLINDVYLKYLKPDASQKQLRTINYASGLLVVTVSVIFGFFAENVNSVLQWIVSALWGSYIVSNVLKWYWWRFNGHGYFWGMVAGIIPALIFPYVFSETLDLYYFPLILVISLAGGIIGTYAAPATEQEVLKKFYSTVKPWGFWKPIYDNIKSTDPDFERNKNFWRDMFNIVIGTIGQTALVALPIYIVLQESMPIFVTVILAIICGLILYKTWYRKLPG